MLTDLLVLGGDSENSWTVDAKSIDKVTYDLSVKSPNKDDESALRDPKEIIAEMAALALVGEDLTVIRHRVLHNLRQLDNPWHEQMLHRPFAPDQNSMESYPSCLLLQTFS